MKRITTILTLLMLLCLGAQATVTQPTLSTNESKTYYTIKNYRSGNYATYLGESTQLGQRNGITYAAVWYFEESGTGVKIVPASAPTKKMASNSSATAEGSTWYLVENPYNDGYFCISLNSDLSGNCWDDAGSNGSIGYYNPRKEDYMGTSWVIEAISASNVTALKTEWDRTDYEISYSKTAVYTRSDRYTISVSLGSESISLPSKNSGTLAYRYIYDNYFTAYRGTQIAPAIGYQGHAMYGYCYIDLNNDGDFSDSGELVSSYGANDVFGTGSGRSQTLPKFRLPSTNGTYRMRFKVDWDNTDPAGSSSIISNGGVIIDVMLHVVDEEMLANAVASIHNGHKYHIYTNYNSIDYYLTTDGELTNEKASAGTFTFTATTTDQVVPAGSAWRIANGNKEFTNPNGNERTNKLRTDNQHRDTYDAQILYLNNQGKYAVRAGNAPANDWGTNTYWMIEDNGDALPDADYTLDETKQFLWQLEDLSITYRLKFNDETIDSVIVDHTDGLNTTATFPAGKTWNRDYCEYTYSPTTITTSTSIVEITMDWDGPFDFSSDAASATWYFMNIRPADNNGRAKRWVNYVNNAFAYSSQGAGNPTIEESAAWAFFGNPLSLKVLNKQSNKYLATTGDNKLTMTDAGVSWIAEAGSTTYEESPVTGTLLRTGTDNYVHDYNDEFARWNSSFAKEDVGSFLTMLPVGEHILSVIDDWESGTKWGDCEETSLTTAKSDPTIANYKAISFVAPSENTYFRINSVSVSGLSMSYVNIDGTDKVKALTKDVNDVNQIWQIKSTEHNKVKLYNVNSQKYIASVVSGEKNTTSLSAAGYNYPITWSEGNFTLGSDYACLRIETKAAYLGNMNAWDNNAVWTAEEVTTLPIGLHTIGEFAYATTYLPFDVTITSGADAYTLEESGDWLVPTQLADNKVPAGTGILLRGTKNTESATATINKSDAFSTSNTNSLLGTYTAKDFALISGTPDATAEYFLGVYDSTVGFYHSGVESKTGYYTLGANKAYLGSATATRGFAINWNDDEVTGIRSIDNGKQSVKNGAFYDLSGRRVENPQHGMYIVNGRVVVIK